MESNPEKSLSLNLLVIMYSAMKNIIISLFVIKIVK